MNPAPKEPDLTTYGGRFAQRIRELRRETGFTPEEIAERLAKFNQSPRKAPGWRAYYDWENARSAPHFDMLPALAKAFKLKTVHELLPEK